MLLRKTVTPFIVATIVGMGPKIITSIKTAVCSLTTTMKMVLRENEFSNRLSGSNNKLGDDRHAVSNRGCYRPHLPPPSVSAILYQWAILVEYPYEVGLEAVLRIFFHDNLYGMGPPGFEPGISGSAGRRPIQARPRALLTVFLDSPAIDFFS